MANRDREIIEHWIREYGIGGAVPVSKLRAYISDNRVGVVRRTYYIDNFSGAIRNQRTYHEIQGGRVAVAMKPTTTITFPRAYWFLLIGTDPKWVGKDKIGLYSSNGRYAPKTYALDLMKKGGVLGGPLIPTARMKIGVWCPFSRWVW